MSRLEVLDLSNNSFGGVIPKCFGNCSVNLVMADLGMNSFHGSILRMHADQCSVLKELKLNGNLLQGRVSRSMAKCVDLQVLDLGNNGINDIFPKWLGTLLELLILVLRSNKFHGPIRSSFISKLHFPKLQILDLSHNELSYILPQRYFRSFKAMRNMEEDGIELKYMVNNATHSYYYTSVVMKGKSYEFMRILYAFTIIDLSNNRFEGVIPDDIGSLILLKVLNLSHNSLSGEIPHVLENLSAIKSLDLSWNRLVGEIPQQLASLTFLSVLNLSQNRLMGRIPKGPQLNTFGSYSCMGNPALCGFPLPRKCGHSPFSLQGIYPDHSASGFTWKVVVLGYGCGTLVGLVMGYLMFLTGKPKWLNAIVEAEEHRIIRMRKKRYHIHIRRRN